MAQITTTTGLVSGIDYNSIITQLMAIEQQPVTQLQTRLTSIASQKSAFQDIGTQLTSLKANGTTLKQATTFENTAATSSDESVLTATTSPGAAVGSYQFQVAQLVTTQQNVSRGFADFSSAKLAAGNITIEEGGGQLTQSNDLSELRGGAGVSRGVFKITDRSGATATIDTTAAVTLDDVVNKINTNLDLSVHASIQNDRIVLTDVTGKTANDLIVQDTGDGTVAADLGIAGSSATNTLTGTDINFLGTNTGLSQLNDGRGVRTASGSGDLVITAADGTVSSVSLATAKTVGDAITAINTAGGSKFKASINTGDNSITLTDTSGGGGTISVANATGSHAADDLGLTTAATGNVITGGAVLAGLGTVLLSSLNGGSGLTTGSITIQNRNGVTSSPIDLTGAKSVADLISTINNAGAGVKASLNQSGNGIQIVDTTAGTGSLTISDSSGTTAAQLGIAGTFTADTATVTGTNLQRQWVNQNSQLKDYNGGNGVSQGKFTITDSTGKNATIQITQNDTRLGDVISKINNAGLGVTASINAHGDGLLLTDTAGGSTKLKVEDTDGTAAANLQIKGTAAATTIDGSFEKTIAVTANDTLSTLQTKINTLGFGVTASIINDGSSSAPYRLSLNAKNSGLDGQVTIDDGATGLGSRTLVKAQDAAVFVGGAGASQPLLITASKNQLSGIISGVTINLNGVSDKPVNLNITDNVDNVVSTVNSFVTTFNGLVDKMNDYTKFDTDTDTGGVLLGDSTVQTVQSQIYTMLNGVNSNAGKYRILADVGITIGDGAKLSFDEEKFRAAYADDPDSVKKLFTESDSVTGVDGKTTTTTPGLGYTIESQITQLIDPVSGSITQEENTLDQRTTQFQSRITELNTLISQKKTRLETQFANLESVLSGLQTQQTALSSFTGIKSSTTSK